MLTNLHLLSQCFRAGVKNGTDASRQYLVHGLVPLLAHLTLTHCHPLTGIGRWCATLQQVRALREEEPDGPGSSPSTSRLESSVLSAACGLWAAHSHSSFPLPHPPSLRRYQHPAPSAHPSPRSFFSSLPVPVPTCLPLTSANAIPPRCLLPPSPNSHRRHTASVDLGLDLRRRPATTTTIRRR